MTCTNNDFINRKMAIDAMYALCDYRCGKWSENPHIDAIVDALNNLPEAQLESEWVHHISKDGRHDYGFDCVHCGKWSVMPEGRSRYCQHCGARMKGIE